MSPRWGWGLIQGLLHGKLALYQLSHKDSLEFDFLMSIYKRDLGDLSFCVWLMLNMVTMPLSEVCGKENWVCPEGYQDRNLGARKQGAVTMERPPEGLAMFLEDKEEWICISVYTLWLSVVGSTEVT